MIIGVRCVSWTWGKTVTPIRLSRTGIAHPCKTKRNHQMHLVCHHSGLWLVVRLNKVKLATILDSELNVIEGTEMYDHVFFHKHPFWL
jgi:hypothetical protein